MRDWLNWTRIVAFLAVGGAVWSNFNGHDTVWLACAVVVAVLMPLNLGVLAYRHWQKGQRQMMSAGRQDVEGVQD